MSLDPSSSMKSPISGMTCSIILDNAFMCDTALRWSCSILIGATLCDVTHLQKARANSITWRLTRQSLLMVLGAAFMEQFFENRSYNYGNTGILHWTIVWAIWKKWLLLVWIKENCFRIWRSCLEPVLKLSIHPLSLLKFVLLKQIVHTSLTTSTVKLVLERTTFITSWCIVRSRLGIVQVGLRSEVFYFFKSSNFPRKLMSFSCIKSFYARD